MAESQKPFPDFYFHTLPVVSAVAASKLQIGHRGSPVSGFVKTPKASLRIGSTRRVNKTQPVNPTSSVETANTSGDRSSEFRELYEAEQAEAAQRHAHGEKGRRNEGSGQVEREGVEDGGQKEGGGEEGGRGQLEDSQKTIELGDSGTIIGDSGTIDLGNSQASFGARLSHDSGGILEWLVESEQEKRERDQNMQRHGGFMQGSFRRDLEANRSYYTEHLPPPPSPRAQRRARLRLSPARTTQEVLSTACPNVMRLPLVAQREEGGFFERKVPRQSTFPRWRPLSPTVAFVAKRGQTQVTSKALQIDMLRLFAEQQRDLDRMNREFWGR